MNEHRHPQHRTRPRRNWECHQHHRGITQQCIPDAPRGDDGLVRIKCNINGLLLRALERLVGWWVITGGYFRDVCRDAGQWCVGVGDVMKSFAETFDEHGDLLLVVIIIVMFIMFAVVMI